MPVVVSISVRQSASAPSVVDAPEAGVEMIAPSSVSRPVSAYRSGDRRRAGGRERAEVERAGHPLARLRQDQDRLRDAVGGERRGADLGLRVHAAREPPRSAPRAGEIRGDAHGQRRRIAPEHRLERGRAGGERGHAAVPIDGDDASVAAAPVGGDDADRRRRFGETRLERQRRPDGQEVGLWRDRESRRPWRWCRGGLGGVVGTRHRNQRRQQKQSQPSVHLRLWCHTRSGGVPSSSEQLPSSSRAAPEQLPSSSRAAPEQLPSSSRAAPEQLPSGSRARATWCAAGGGRWRPRSGSRRRRRGRPSRAWRHRPPRGRP